MKLACRFVSVMAQRVVPCFKLKLFPLIAGLNVEIRNGHKRGASMMREQALCLPTMRLCLWRFFRREQGVRVGLELRIGLIIQARRMENLRHHGMIKFFGTGDGVKTTFQLIKQYGDDPVFYTRDIRKPVIGSVTVGMDDTEYSTGWSVDNTTGIVTFVQAPAVGAIIKAGFQFDVPVRFDTDCLNVSSIDKNTAKAEIPLIEVRV